MFGALFCFYCYYTIMIPSPLQPELHEVAKQNLSYTRHLAGLSRVCRRGALPVLLLVALLHGLQYAALMPPWGLIDEAQHVDYIAHVAQRQELPIAGKTTLSPEIVNSLFATRHWQIFHWSTPASDAIADLGVVGYSYEAYHPPLYYLLLAPVYLSVPGSILDRLFVLRGATVLLSLATVWLFYRLSRLLSSSTHFTILATLIFIMLPERTIYVSRVNNDALVELLGCAVCLVAAEAILHSMTRLRAFGLGLLLALGIWTKLSMTFWLLPLTLMALWWWQRPDRWRWLLPPAIGMAAFIVLAIRNLLLYGDVIGYSAFHNIYRISAPPVQAAAIVSVILDLFRHFWFIWWKGSQTSSSVFTLVVYLLLAALTGGSIVLGVRGLVQMQPMGYIGWRSNRRLALLTLLATAGAVYLSATMYSYFQGVVPVVQGRFLAPAIVVYVLLFAYGWWQHRAGAKVLLLTAFLLFVVDLALLWGNLLPYHYYWSSVNASVGEFQVAGDAAQLFWSNLVADKPPQLALLLPLLALTYWIAATLALIMSWRCARLVYEAD